MVVDYIYTHILHQNPSNRYLKEKGKHDSKCAGFDDLDIFTLNWTNKNPNTNFRVEAMKDMCE